MVPVPSCQCARHDKRCASDITQEDLLCDACRPGTCAMRYRGILPGWQYHSHVDWPGPRPGDYDDPGGVRARVAAVRRLDEAFPGESSWIDAGAREGSGPLHLVDAAGRPYLNPDAPLIPHDHNGVPCKYVP